MTEQLALAGIPTAQPPKAKRLKPTQAPASAEVATVQKAEFLAPLAIQQFPNLSTIIRNRSEGQGIRFYDTMFGTDADLAGFFEDQADEVLHYPAVVRAASDAPDHREHARFMKFTIASVPQHLNAWRHFLTAYPRGFSVTEKMYTVVQRGEWSGAVIFVDLLDKKQRWFGFDMDRRLRFLTLQNMYPGELVDQDKFVVCTFGTNSDPWGRALLDLCYYPWLLKHHGMKNQAIYFEKWASPTARVQYEAGPDKGMNDKNKEKALVVGQSIQNDQTVAYPKGMILDLIESARNGTISFESYINQLTKMESRIVTGQLLTMMGDEGGSHALGKVHEKRAANRAEMLAAWLSSFVSRVFRELIDRNFGPQDVYPRYEILARALLEKQAFLAVEQSAIANGHRISRAWSDDVLQLVLPEDASDELQSPAGVKPGQTLPVSTGLASGPGIERARLLLAAHASVHAHASARAQEKLAQLDRIGREATAKARPAIKRIVKSIAGRVSGRKSLKGLRRANVYGALKGASGSADLGAALHQMLDLPSRVKMAAADEQPPDISTTAKLALALQMMAIAERIYGAAQDAPEGTAPEAFADSLTDPNGVAVDGAFANLFEGNHGTNVASIATAKLRRQLDDPAFRQKFPYVMIVATNPNARLSHRMMDGYILSAEEARYSPFLPPFDFGCDCQVIPIAADIAKEMGLTGAAPAGTLAQFLGAKGVTQTPYSVNEFRGPNGETFTAGAAPGFRPAYNSTDMYVQLEALRRKAEEIRREDPEGWAAVYTWLLWLFGLDILTQDPPPDQVEQPAA